MTRPFSVPDQRTINEAEVTKFIRYVNAKHALSLRDFHDLHTWSIEQSNDFYEAIWQKYTVIGDMGECPLFEAGADITQTKAFVPRARLNYAENALLGHANARSDDKLALIGAIEQDSPNSQPITRSVTFAKLYDEVNSASHALKKLGIVPGDYISAYSAMNIDSCVALLATAALGAIFSSGAIEMASNGILDRLGQIQPKCLFAVSSYRFGGKNVDASQRLHEVASGLAKVGLKHVILSEQLPGIPARMDKISGVRIWTYSEFLAFGERGRPAEIPFWRGPAMAPLWVLYSSGTTGKPKALVHNVVGMVLTSKISNILHLNCTPRDLQIQSTTLGWMMFNNSVGLLLVGGGVVAYDGSPLAPFGRLFDLVERTNATMMGLSPRFLDILQKNFYLPSEKHNLKTLRAVICAGSPLKPMLYIYIIDSIQKDVFICNGSGGTDVCGALASGMITLPIFAGILQVPLLGVALECWSDEGIKVTDDGNMVVTRPLPNMPLGLHGDAGGERYRATYFDDFLPRRAWNQGDLIHYDYRGISILGRSDAVLNPQGVRFGTAELYDAVEDDCMAVPLKFDGDEKVVLFVVTEGGKALPPQDVKRISDRIRSRLSIRHVPSIFIGVTAIPCNGSAKKLEVPVRKLINGTPRDKVNTTACINPECLQEYRADRQEFTVVHSKRPSKL